MLERLGVVMLLISPLVADGNSLAVPFVVVAIGALLVIIGGRKHGRQE